MNKRKAISIVFIAVLVCLAAFGGYALGKNGNKEQKKTSTLASGEMVQLHITNVQHMPAGTAYTIEMKNTSGYRIKQNSVFISYTIEHDNIKIMNKCKVEATGNKLDMMPGEKHVLNVFMPMENYQDNTYINTKKPAYEVEGYLVDVSELNHFQQSGEFSREEGEL